MMTAADIMTTDVVTISGSATVADAVKLMKEKGLRSLIVDRRNDQDPYGIISETDVVYKVAAFDTGGEILLNSSKSGVIVGS